MLFMFDPKKIKKDFPIYNQHPNLVYLDSGATSLKPRVVVEKITEYYNQYSANIHRGIYQISELASLEYEETRSVVATFIGADSPSEIVFTRNSTESINLIASTVGQDIIESGDEIVTSIMEHHSNFVPWQQLAFSKGADFKVINIENYELRIKNDKSKIDLSDIITKKTKILALTLVSNVLGTINPIKEISQAARKMNPNIIIVVDAAQAVPHMLVDVKNLGCDFLVFSSHKMFGPTGVGVLWGKANLLKKMDPYQYGGDMIDIVSLEKTTFAEPPHRFEAGTPNIAGVIGLKAAIRYIKNIGIENIKIHENKLANLAIAKLDKAFGEKIRILGPKADLNRSGIISFTINGVHPHDIAQICDEEQLAVRAGHHCAMPLHTCLNIPASTRASFYIYNTPTDVDKLAISLQRAVKILKK